MNFGNRLVEVREQLGFNQNDFALKIELAPQSLSRYEKNKVKPSIEMLTKLTDMFNDFLPSENGTNIFFTLSPLSLCMLRKTLRALSLMSLFLRSYE